MSLPVLPTHRSHSLHVSASLPRCSGLCHHTAENKAAIFTCAMEPRRPPFSSDGHYNSETDARKRRTCLRLWQPICAVRCLELHLALTPYVARRVTVVWEYSTGALPCGCFESEQAAHNHQDQRRRPLEVVHHCQVERREQRYRACGFRCKCLRKGECESALSTQRRTSP